MGGNLTTLLLFFPWMACAVAVVEWRYAHRELAAANSPVMQGTVNVPEEFKQVILDPKKHLKARIDEITNEQLP